MPFSSLLRKGRAAVLSLVLAQRSPATKLFLLHRLFPVTRRRGGDRLRTPGCFPPGSARSWSLDAKPRMSNGPGQAINTRATCAVLVKHTGGSPPGCSCGKQQAGGQTHCHRTSPAQGFPKRLMVQVQGHLAPVERACQRLPHASRHAEANDHSTPTTGIGPGARLVRTVVAFLFPLDRWQPQQRNLRTSYSTTCANTKRFLPPPAPE
jgi:hypothetical protein